MRRVCWRLICFLGGLCLLAWVSPAVGSTDRMMTPQEQEEGKSANLAVLPMLSHQNSQWWTVCMLSAGIRRDNFDWSISGDRNGESPNILSELEWFDVESYQIQLTNRTMLADILYLRATLGYAGIISGTLRDSDYAEDDRESEYSRSISKSSDDALWDAALGVGYPFYFANRSFMAAPMIGASFHQQRFHITDGVQVLTEAGGYPLGSINGLNSTYQAQWLGPWLGFDARYCVNPRTVKMPFMEFGLFMQWHWNSRFRAEADWNLRSDFEHPKSFEQEADGQGIGLTADWLIKISSGWAVNFSANYQRWRTEPGSQRYYFSSGDTSETRLNEVNWESCGCTVALVYRFL